MGAVLNSAEFIELLERLEKSSETVQRRAARAANEEFKRQMKATKVGPTGRLRASLTSDNVDHIFTLGIGGRIRMGSRDPASRFSLQSVPRIDPRPFIVIIADELFRGVRGPNDR